MSETTKQNQKPQTELQPSAEQLRRTWMILLLCLIIVSFLTVIFLGNSKNVRKDTNISSPTAQPTTPKEKNPFMEARNIKRRADVIALANALEAYENERGALPPGITKKIQPIAKSGADICSDITSIYIGGIPRDPLQQFDPNNPYATGGFISNCNEAYDSGYMIVKNDMNQFTISAPKTENMTEISVTK